MKKIILLLIVLQGVLMAEMVKEIKIKDALVPVVFEEGKYIPIVSIQLVFDNAGHLSNPKGKDGLADMSAKLLNEGTSRDGSVGFATKLDAHAVEVSANVGRENFVLEVSALKSEFSYAVDRLKELLKDPNYTKDAMEHIERQKIGWLTHMQSNFDYVAATKLREILFRGTALARPYNGTLTSVKDISLEDVKSFISSHVGYNNVIAVVGGDISFDEAAKYLEELLPLLPKVEVKNIGTIKASNKRETLLIDEETQQAYIYFGAPFDYSYKERDQYKAKIAEYLLGGAGFGSRLMEEIRVKRGLTYGAYSALRRTKAASYLSGYLQTKLSTQDEAKELVQKVVDDFVNKGITKEELKAAKDFLVGSEPLRTETLSQRLNRAYHEYSYERPLGFSKEQLKKIESVTLEEMNAFIKSHKELSDISFAIVTKK
jgi:predicted Zn-dependent peptidase